MTGIVFSCIVPHPPIIIPDIGRGEEKKIAATSDAMDMLTGMLAHQNPDAVIIISPHGNYISDSMGIATAPTLTGDLNAWGISTPRLNIDNDPDLVGLIQKEAKLQNIPLASIGQKGYNLDHGVMVPLHFLYRALKGVPLIPLTFSWLSRQTHFEFGKVLRKAAEQSNKHVAIIASGDLSHRLIPTAPAGYDPMGKTFDEKLVKALSEMDTKGIMGFDEIMVERAGECGLRSIIIMLGALDGLNVKTRLLSYEGPFGVGYMVAAFEVKD